VLMFTKRNSVTTALTPPPSPPNNHHRHCHQRRHNTTLAYPTPPPPALSGHTRRFARCATVIPCLRASRWLGRARCLLRPPRRPLHSPSRCRCLLPRSRRIHRWGRTNARGRRYLVYIPSPNQRHMRLPRSFFVDINTVDLDGSFATHSGQRYDVCVAPSVGLKSCPAPALVVLGDIFGREPLQRPR
jgi:hypothetical protein